MRKEGKGDFINNGCRQNVGGKSDVGFLIGNTQSNVEQEITMNRTVLSHIFALVLIWNRIGELA
ncbi:MAG: hypothetical protein A2W35_08970 [Chloroflexi bacterium RBG_16_57_11]|nr:MAG: hypothetical protein A2W35_08970 [Chloroflexi bacterium RBG_16_57_11]